MFVMMIRHSLSADSNSHVHSQLITAHRDTATSKNRYSVQHILSVIQLTVNFFHTTRPHNMVRINAHFHIEDCAPAVPQRYPVAGFGTQ